MPYKIVKTKKGFKVCKADLSKCFSKKPLSKDTAEKQMRAIYMNEKKKMDLPSSSGGGQRSTNEGGSIKEFVKKSGGLPQIILDVGLGIGKYLSGITHPELTEAVDTMDAIFPETAGYKPDWTRYIGPAQEELLPMLKETGQNIYNYMTAGGKKEGGCGFCCLMDGGAKPLTARLGGKVLLKKQIVKKFFPNPIDYNTYVEPFVGGGSVYFFKDKENHKEIVNDIDPNIYTIFKGFQKYGPEKIATEVNGDYTKKDFEKLLEFQPTNDFNKFIKTFLLNRLSYFSRGKTFGKPRIHSNFKGYQERLKDATILNEDYKKVISKYDGPNVFFYLDPPYKPSQTQYHYPAINLKELKKVVDGIKGKFLISIPDGNEVTKLFKDYNIFEIKTKYVGRRQQGGQTIPTRELLVSNYKPKMEGGATPLDKELYEKVKAEIYKKNKKHSLFRSAQIAKEYKKRGGKWIDDEKKQMNINKWFKQKWISLNDYYHNDAVVACGNSDTYEKFNEYPLCRPLALAKKLGKEKIGELIQKKEGPKPVRSEKVLGTDKYNIKSSLSGTGGMDKFHKQLSKVGLTHDLYMKAVKHLAKSSGYDPKLVEMSDDGDHKLVYHSPEGLKRFGKVGYGDYIIWSAQEAKGKVPKGTAEQKRQRFRKSHGAMSKIHNLGKYSPNELAINLLW